MSRVPGGFRCQLILRGWFGPLAYGTNGLALQQPPREADYSNMTLCAVYVATGHAVRIFYVSGDCLDVFRKSVERGALGRARIVHVDQIDLARPTRPSAGRPHPTALPAFDAARLNTTVRRKARDDPASDSSTLVSMPGYARQR